MTKKDLQDQKKGSLPNQGANKEIEMRDFEFGRQDANQDKNFELNFIRTSKYTSYNFLPLCLLLQFRRYANIYFLIIAILQSIPDISPLHPFAAWAPLIFVIAISMIREGLEDLQRHKSDVELNSSECKVYNFESKRFEKQLWSNIKVGDWVKVEINETFPTDIIVINSSNAEGVCFIETSSLDGEKNLKPKGAMHQTLNWFQDKEPNTTGTITCIPPDQDLYKFEGTIKPKSGNQKIQVDSKQFLLRGSKLKNTKWIVGIVCYTGNDTKIMKNADKSKFKQSNIENLTNKLILIILLFQLIVSLTSAIGAGIWTSQNFENHYYLNDDKIDDDEKAGVVGVLTLFTYIVLNNTMIPISLIVSLEIVKQIQGFLISWDQEMYCDAKQRGPKVFTTSINEELGQIEYIFSDKTGTLTCNIMEFKLLMVGADLFGNFEVLGKNSEIKQKEDIKRQQIRPKQPKTKTFQKRPTKLVDRQSEIEVNSIDATLVNLLELNEQDEQCKDFLTKEFNSFTIKNHTTKKPLYEIKNRKQLAQEIMMLLSTCHECVVEQNDDEEEGEKKDDDIQKHGGIIRPHIRYQGPSPDEVTLVDIARHFGYVFKKQTSSKVVLEIFKCLDEKNPKFESDTKHVDFELLMLFPFDSDRKRMSVIIKHNGLIKLFIKGADNMILERLEKTEQCKHKEQIMEYIGEFSKKGLRTLLLAMKVIEPSEFAEYQKQYDALADVKDKEKGMAELGERIEQNLYLLGATAVEDKLQERVPETIRDLLLAKIKVWMLTGDKMETAENIARSCKLIQPDFKVMSFTPEIQDPKNPPTHDEIDIELNKKVKQTKEIMEQKNKQSKALLIEGQYLQEVLKEEIFKDKLIKIIQNCEAVVCCRATPKQKAQVVNLVKAKLNKITLAIGDGANDVNMIQEAHIGVGLYGQEGMRAVQASDYALPEFQQLWRLVLVHGRWSYIRISEMILYFFYKNFAFTIPQFYFSFSCAFSGQTVFDDWYITLYNIIFTALPLIVRAITEQDVNFKINRDSADKYMEQNKKDSDGHQTDQESEFSPDNITNIADQKQIKYKKFQGVLRHHKNEKHLKHIYPKLYYIGQQNKIFNMRNFFVWMFQGVVHAAIVYVFHIMAIHRDQAVSDDGYSPDLWFFSIAMYTSIIFIVNLKLMLHTEYQTGLLYATMLLTSIAPYILYIVIASSIEDFSVYQTSTRMFSSPDFYLIVFLCVGLVFAFDACILYYLNNEEKGLVEYVKFVIKYKKFNAHRFMKPLQDVKGFELQEKPVKIDFSYTSERGNNNLQN